MNDPAIATPAAVVAHGAPLPERAEVVVVGAGLAGLAAARALQAAGHRPLVLEASDGIGGRVRTDVVDGFRLDRGFQILLTAYPEVQSQLDLASLHLARFSPGSRVVIDGRLCTVADPFRAPAALPATVFAPVGSLADKLRIARLRADVTRTPAARLLTRAETTTLERLQRAGFSERMIERFFRPLFAGIQLDASLATSSRLFDVYFRSLALGDAAVPAAGMGAIPADLAGRLHPGCIHLHARVGAVDADGVTLVDGRRVGADHAVIVAAEGPAAAGLLGLTPVASKSVSCVWFAADASPAPGGMLVLDGGATGPVQNLAVLSDVAPTYAPAGRTLIAAAAPGTHGDELAEAARRQLTGWFGARVADWRVLRVDHIAHAQPDQRPPFHPRQRVRLAERIFVAGDHRDTASIQGALFSGRRCGEAVARHLRATATGRTS
jgi:phytoene dehydrogenase-like protein